MVRTLLCVMLGFWLGFVIAACLSEATERREQIRDLERTWRLLP